MDKVDLSLDAAALGNVDPVILSALKVGQKLVLAHPPAALREEQAVAVSTAASADTSAQPPLSTEAEPEPGAQQAPAEPTCRHAAPGDAPASTSGASQGLYFCTEDGVPLARVSDPHMARRFSNARVMIRGIRRDTATGAVQQLQVRLYAGQGEPGATTRRHTPLPVPSRLNPPPGLPAGSSGARPGLEGPGPSYERGLQQHATPSVADEEEYQLRREQYEALGARRRNPELVFESLVLRAHIRASLS
jgi:hypothetical protein